MPFQLVCDKEKKKKKDILVINGNEYTEIVTSKYLFTFFLFFFEIRDRKMSITSKV